MPNYYELKKKSVPNQFHFAAAEMCDAMTGGEMERERDIETQRSEYGTCIVAQVWITNLDLSDRNR